MAFNIYLKRATRSLDPVIRRPAKVIAGTLGYMDRLMGTSATKMRNKANLVSSIAKSHASAGDTTKLDNLGKVLGHRADTLTRQSNATRIKTGLSIGGAVLAHKAYSNYKANQAYTQPDYSNYQQYY